MATLNLQVGASADDAAESYAAGIVDTDGDLIAETVPMGDFFGWAHGGYRFTGVSGLSGATINSGTKLIFRAKWNDSGSFLGDFYAEDAAAPATFAETTNNITNRTRTTATCEADSSDFGTWTNSTDYDFPLIAGMEIANIIQELASSYDSSEIVMLFIYTSGTGERVVTSYDDTTATAPKLVIDYTAAGPGSQTVYPAALTVEPAIPAPTVAPGAATLTPTTLAMSPAFPAPTVTPTITRTATALSLGPAFPTATVVATVTVTATALSVSPVFPVPTLQLSGTITLGATAFTVSPVFPTPTLVPGAVTLTPATLSLSPALPVPTIATTVTLTPAALTETPGFPTPTVVPGTATLTPGAFVLSVYFPATTIVGGGVTLLLRRWGRISWNLNPADYPSGTQWRVIAWIATKASANPVYARLYDESHGEGIAASQISGTEDWPTADEDVIPTVGPLFSLPSGNWRYSIQFGGIPGGEFICYGAVLEFI